MIKIIVDYIKRCVAAYRGGEHLINWYRSKGIKIGKNCRIGPYRTLDIDLSRPYLIEIGDNVRINYGMTIMTHDFAALVFKKLKSEFIPSSGKVKIGNNVYFGRNCTVLKNVTIGDNVIVGYGSLVIKDVPSNVVVAGAPAKVVCTLDEYYEKRCKLAKYEALQLAQYIRESLGREPIPSDFKEEFVYFVSGETIQDYPDIPIEFQLKMAGGVDIYNAWKENHVPIWKSFDDFLEESRLKK